MLGDGGVPAEEEGAFDFGGAIEEMGCGEGSRTVEECGGGNGGGGPEGWDRF